MLASFHRTVKLRTKVKEGDAEAPPPNKEETLFFFVNKETDHVLNPDVHLDDTTDERKNEVL